MKKLLVTLCAFFLLGTLTACSSGKEDEKKEEPQTQEEIKQEETPKEEEKKEEEVVPPVASTTVTPELKAWLDEYEAFYDEYIAFMQKYKTADSASMLSLLADYTKMLGQIEKWDEKLEEYDFETMSAADQAYYIEVTTRIEQKLLNAAI